MCAFSPSWLQPSWMPILASSALAVALALVTSSDLSARSLPVRSSSLASRVERLDELAQESSPRQAERRAANTALLRRGLTVPRDAGESNFFIDLWNPGELATFARAAGLTNNHALFIDSHGKASTVLGHEGYCFYPNAKLLNPAAPVPFFSVADLASLLGPAERNTIHNVVLTGCNQEGALQSQLVRRYFANATNIVYMEPGKPAYKPMLYQVLTSHSTQIKPLYGRLHSLPEGVLQCKVSLTPEPGTGELGRYVADLFLPGARNPYRHQTAGRELLEGGERNRTLNPTTGQSR